jgi:uracil-DNA glycosylase
MKIPSPWADLVRVDDELARFVAAERARGPVYPREEHVFAALSRTAPDAVRVVILGQDPYHGEGQAHGLAFSVPRGVARPPSLVNIHKELAADLGHAIPSHGCLECWADRGVLLLNTVLTVREGEAGSHAGRGWEAFTDSVLDALAQGPRPIVFVLWGSHAHKKAKLVERAPHRVLRGVHPSPLSAHRGFFGSRPFSTTNAFLAESGEGPIDWSIR